MKLQQGQIWQTAEAMLIITKWERMTIRYKTVKELVTREGEQFDVSKKEFCRLIKGAHLLTPEEIAELSEMVPEVEGPLEGEPPLLTAEDVKAETEGE